MKHDATLCLPIKESKVLLGMKKRGFGEGKLNGFGGKVREDETIEQAVVRELYEEIGIRTKEKYLRKVAELDYTFPFAQDKGWDQIVHVYFVENWRGKPKESEEMGFEWHDNDKIPFHRMWHSDQYWIPQILKGKKIKATFVFREDNQTVDVKEICEVPL